MKFGGAFMSKIATFGLKGTKSGFERNQGEKL